MAMSGSDAPLAADPAREAATAAAPRTAPPAAVGSKLRFTTLAHSTHRYCSPLTGLAQVAAAELSSLLTADDTVLDIGCGKGAFLHDVLSKSAAVGVGVDVNASFLAEARGANSAGLAERVEFIEQDAAAFLSEAQAAGKLFKCILCVGALGVLGEATLTAGLQRLAQVLAPGGVLVLGETFWKAEPSAEYLSAVGMPREAMDTLGVTVKHVTAAGLDIQEALLCSERGFRAYETEYAGNVRAWLEANAADPDAEAFRARIDTWNGAFEREGHAVMGFALLLLRKRAAAVTSAAESGAGAGAAAS
jgi:cyclopropane fatty-acyl-phospholipid synthase-like methyltransferase